MKEIDYKTYRKPSDFMKFEAGESVIRILSKGFIGGIHGLKTANRYVPLGTCKLPEYCEFCVKANKPKKVWRWIILDKKHNEIKLLDAGPMVGDQIAQMGHDHGDPTNYDIKVTKTGEGKQSQYKAEKAGPDQPLTDAERTKLRPSFQYLAKQYLENQ